MKIFSWKIFAGLAVVVTGVVYLFVASRQSLALVLQPDNREMVQIGNGLYKKYCASCHGVKLEGQPDWRNRLANGRLPAPPHDQTGHTWHHNDALLFKITKLGTKALAGENYETDMRGFGGDLSDGEIIAVLSYIKSTWPAQIQKRHDAMNLPRQQN